jgi:outer membrane biosynthesis protein TonB
MSEGVSDAAARRPGSGQRAAARDGDEASSEADSFLTASSSAALLAPEGFPLAGPQRAAHTRSASGSSLGGFSAVAGSPAPPAISPPLQQLEQRQGGEQVAPGPAWEPPLVDLGDVPPAAAHASADQQLDEQRPPALQLGAGPPPPAERQRQQPGEQVEQQPPLLDLGEVSAEQPVKQPGPAQQPNQEQQHEPEQQQQQGSGVEVQIVTRSFSSSGLAAAHAAADMLPRDDLLAGPPGGGRNSRRLGQRLLPPAEAAGGVAPSAGSQPDLQLESQEAPGAGQQTPASASDPQQQQQQQQGGEVEVVRVTATNLDMSRPLRSADLLAVYRASVVPRPGQASTR